jgi:hypothetical protein
MRCSNADSGTASGDVRTGVEIDGSESATVQLRDGLVCASPLREARGTSTHGHEGAGQQIGDEAQPRREFLRSSKAAHRLGSLEAVESACNSYEDLWWVSLAVQVVSA